jgi:pentatricopeptide repeat protein
MNELFQQLKEKHIVRTAVVYLGGAWLLLEATGFFVDNYALSRHIIDVVLLLVLLGFPAALIISWHHGEKGRQNIARSEASLLLTLVVLGAIGTYRITTAGEVARPATSGAPTATSSDPTSRFTSANDLGERSVAVLPFTNATGLDSLDWVGSGVADMLTTSLARDGDMRVVSPQRLFELLRAAGREESAEIPADAAMSIAGESGARQMVRGSVLGTLDDLVFDVQLIDLADGTVVGGDRVRGTDVFAMSDSVATWLTSALSAGQRPRLARTRSGDRPPIVLSGDPERLKEYSVALRDAWQQEGVDARYRVVDLLDDLSGRESEVRGALEEILAINPNDSRALRGLVRVSVAQSDQPALDSLIPRYLASEADSTRARMTIGRAYERTGRMEDARDVYRGMLDRGEAGTDPLDRIARTYLMENSPGRARSELERISRRAGPDIVSRAGLLTADTYVWQGDFDTALPMYAEVERSGSTQTRAAALEGSLAVQWLLDPNDGASRINRSVWTLLDLGREQQALNVIEGAERMYVRESDRLAPVDVHALLYARGRAFELMGATGQARAAYEELLRDWGDVIARLPLLADARERLSGLKA